MAGNFRTTRQVAAVVVVVVATVIVRVKGLLFFSPGVASDRTREVAIRKWAGPES